MTEEAALAYITRGLVVAIGTKRCVRELRWMGTPLPNVTTPEEAAGYKASEARPTKYSHNHEAPDNPENVWTLTRLPRSTRKIFIEVVTDCIRPFRYPEVSASRSPNQTA
jgi:hypothetical protein